MSFSLEIDKNSAYLITDEYSKRYFSGLNGFEGFVVITNIQTAYFTDARYFYALKQKLKKTNIKAFLFKSIDTIKEYLEDNCVKTLYIDFDKTTLAEYEKYKTFGVEILNGREEIVKSRMAKTQTEIDNIVKACEIASSAFEYILPFIKEGVTEKSIKNRLERFMKKQGAEKPSFETIVAFGKNSAVPHHQTSNARLKKNQAVLLDYGAVVNGYCSDITRTIFYGTPSEKFVKTFNAVANANLLGQETAIQGEQVNQVDSKIREYFSSLEVADKFTHSLGHGVGLEIHEDPYLSPKGKGELKENYVFTIEPGLYYDGEFGIRIENTVVIKDGKAQSLTGNGRQLIIKE